MVLTRARWPLPHAAALRLAYPFIAFLSPLTVPAASTVKSDRRLATTYRPVYLSSSSPVCYFKIYAAPRFYCATTILSSEQGFLNDWKKKKKKMNYKRETRHGKLHFRPAQS